MQLKRTIKIVYILAVFVLFYLALPPTRVEAQACGGDCSVVKCDNQPRCRIIGRELYCPVAYCSQCGGSGCERVGCPPGEFMANDGCRPIGAVDNCPCGTKPSGVCNSCEEDLPPPEPPAIPTEIPTPTHTLTPTPTPLPVNILVRGVNLPAIPQLCDQIKASTDYRTGSVFDVTKNGTSIGQQTQSGSTYLSWIDTAGTYAVSSAEVASSAVRYCLTDGTGSTFGPSTVVAPAGTTQTFDVSFSPFGPWFQTKGGGDVYSSGKIVSKIPPSAVPRVFLSDGGPAGSLFPGIPIYGSTAVLPYDFDESPSSQGETIVSSKDWLVNQAHPTKDLYGTFYRKFDSPTIADYTNEVTPISQPVSRVKPYYILGDVTTTGNWTVGDGEKLILLVDGSITISGQMHTTGTGIIVVIAKTEINFSPAVGVGAGISTPSIEGVYIAGSTLRTGASTTPGSERFVGKGMFIGNALALERDLASAVGGNLTTSAHLFIYNPGYLFSLPAKMLDRSISWQEVAP